MKPSEALKEKMAEFKLAVAEMPCAACGISIYGGWRAHHVVYRQHLPVEQEWNPANAMPVCDGFGSNGCHERHHNASKRIPLSALSEENLEFANEVLGEAAPYYLERRYGQDAR